MDLNRLCLSNESDRGRVRQRLGHHDRAAAALAAAAADEAPLMVRYLAALFSGELAVIDFQQVLQQGEAELAAVGSADVGARAGVRRAAHG